MGNGSYDETEKIMSEIMFVSKEYEDTNRRINKLNREIMQLQLDLKSEEVKRDRIQGMLNGLFRDLAGRDDK